MLTTHDSRERDYDGEFQIRGVKGNVNIDQVPVRVLAEVTGDVRYMATNEFVNRGTLHTGNQRIFSPYETHRTEIDQIGGKLQARFLRTELRLGAIAGSLDVINEYGDTHLTLDAPNAEGSQRVISESGRIEVEGPAEVLDSMPIYAYTQCGRLETNLSREVLDDADFSTGRPQRGWRGLVTPSQDRYGLARFERPAAALEDRERAAGLDLISNCGTVVVRATTRRPEHRRETAHSRLSLRESSVPQRRP